MFSPATATAGSSPPGTPSPPASRSVAEFRRRDVLADDQRPAAVARVDPLHEAARAGRRVVGRRAAGPARRSPGRRRRRWSGPAGGGSASRAASASAVGVADGGGLGAGRGGERDGQGDEPDEPADRRSPQRRAAWVHGHRMLAASHGVATLRKYGTPVPPGPRPGHGSAPDLSLGRARAGPARAPGRTRS